MMSFLHLVLRHKKTAALLLCASLAGAFYLTASRHHHPPLSPNVTQPVFAVEALQAWNPQSLYFTYSAHDYLAAKKPEWISSRDTKQDALDFTRAEQDSALWRRLDHKFHFDAVLLCGDPSEYHFLLEHLIVTKDWTLVYLDHTSMIFRRAPAKQWDLDDFRALQQKFVNYPYYDRAVFLTQSASKLLAIGQTGLAKLQLDESMRLDNESPETWTQMAVYNSQSTHPDEALKDIDSALKLDKNNTDALTAEAKILFSMKRFSDALEISGRLVQATPDNPGVLFYHSLIAHQAHAYTQEISTLQHLVEIVSAQNQPVAGFRIYLAQAYAKDGQAQPALDEFAKALAEGGLSDEQRKFIDETVAAIRNRTSL